MSELNATIQSTLNARNPQYVPSRTPRVIAAIAAVVVTLVLFDGVALLGGHDNGIPVYEAGPVVAQVAQAASTSGSVTR